MSGVGGYLSPPYSNVPYRRCPVCGKPVKNFEAHTRNKNSHKEFRESQKSIFQKLMEEFQQKYRYYPNEFDISTMYQLAWIEAIKVMGGSVEPVQVEERRPSYALTKDTVCPKTGKKADLKFCKAHCLSFAVHGSPTRPKYYVCMELKYKR
jgi:hypothetical protein